MNVLAQLAHPVVRDLAWAVFSEDLILAGSIGSAQHSLYSCGLSQLTPAREAWLLGLDQSPEALLEQVRAARDQRLGLYFEALWHFFLHSDPEAELLAHNLPVREGGRTVGEFDCLYRCRDSGQVVHLELAVKFYLYTGADSGGTGDGRADWLGPGRRDRLDRKLDHLATRQTRLADESAARRLLESRGLMPARREVAVKGRLFRRPDQSCLPPPGFNTAQALMSWGSPDTLTALLADKHAKYALVLPRQCWLSPLQLSEAPLSGLLPPEGQDRCAALQTQLAGSNRPVLVATLDSEYRELQRFFVAPTGWPGATNR